MSVFLGQGARTTFQNNQVISWQMTAACHNEVDHYELHFIAYSTRNRCISINSIKRRAYNQGSVGTAWTTPSIPRPTANYIDVDALYNIFSSFQIISYSNFFKFINFAIHLNIIYVDVQQSL